MSGLTLDNYKQSLAEHKILAAFPIPVEELCSRYEALYTAAVNDVLREDGILYQTLPNTIMPLREEMKVCGEVFTIRSSPSMDVEDEMVDRAKMLEAIPQNSVVVWDGASENVSAHWGEMMTKASMRCGCRGAFVDGGVRDTKKVLEQNFPIFVRYRSSNGILGRTRINGYQIPVKIGEVVIYPGDIAFGDIDGCIIIPRNIAYDVLLRAEQIQRNEDNISQWIEEGISPTEVVDRGGYF